jgi:D-arabinose 1-dehydrogenase-like Zn-dependent alcohol dehydrogenase
VPSRLVIPLGALNRVAQASFSSVRSITALSDDIIENDWGDAQFPLVPGHEIVGIVEEAGSAVTDLQTGDRVGIGYQQEACFAYYARRSVYGNYIGSRADTVKMLAFSAEHGIRAIVEVMPFHRMNEAIERVRRRDFPMGLVLENRD